MNSLKRIIYTTLLSVITFFNICNYTYAIDTHYPRLNVDDNLKLYVSGQSVYIKGKTHNPYSLGKTHTDAISIPAQYTLKGIKYNSKNTKSSFSEVSDISSLDKLFKLLDLPEQLPILAKFSTLDDSYITLPMTIFDLKNQRWSMDYAGCGTISFVTEDKKYFGLLAHGIGLESKFDKLEVYSAKNVHINKLEGNVLSSSDLGNLIGTITHSTKEGTFGKVSNFNEIKTIGKYKIAPLNIVDEGDAQIVSTSPKTQNPELIDINIKKLYNSYDKKSPYTIKYSLSKKSKNKVRQELSNGYSGSPIIQNNKLVGATSIKYLGKNNIGGIDIYNYLNAYNNLNNLDSLLFINSKE